MIKKMIDKMDKSRVDALLTLLSNANDSLVVSEDDRAIAEYRQKLHEQGNMIPSDKAITNLKRRLDKRKIKKSIENKAILHSWIDHLDEKRLDAIETLLNSPNDNLYVSEEDWAIIEYRARQAEEGKVKMIPVEESLKRIKAEFKKRKK